MNNTWSVYIHTTPSGKKYIGITSINPKERWNGGISGYKGQIFEYAIRKYGWNNIIHEIIATNLSQEEACILEQILIKKYNTTNSKYGYNVAEGGLSNITENTKIKMRKNHANVKGIKNPRARKVICIETNQVFDTLKEAAKFYNTDPSNISNCCTGKHKTCIGLHFKYYDNGKPLKNRKKKPVHSIKSNNTSGYRGVSYSRRDNKWIAQLRHNYKNHYLGSFNTPEEAYKARLKAENIILGEIIDE